MVLKSTVLVCSLKLIQTWHYFKSEKKENSTTDKLEEKLKELADELQREKNYEKQQQILRSINEIIAIKEKLKKL